MLSIKDLIVIWSNSEYSDGFNLPLISKERDHELYQLTRFESRRVRKSYRYRLLLVNRRKKQKQICLPGYSSQTQNVLMGF